MAVHIPVGITNLLMSKLIKMEINEKLVKISAGLVPIEGELKLGDDVQILLSGTVTKTEQMDNQDGTYNLVFVVKGIVSYVNDEEVTA